MPAIASQPDSPAWDVDADWWGPGWDVVEPVSAAEPTSGSGRSHTVLSEPAELDVPVSVTSYVAEADPSWGQIVASTVRLWVLRRWPGAGLAWRRAGAELAWLRWPGFQRRGPAVDGPSPAVDSPAAAPARLPGRRPRVVGWASGVWAAHARLLSAAMLGAGLLAVGAGAAGLVAARASSPPSVRLKPVAAPSGRTVAPLSVSAVQQQTPKPVSLTIPAIGVKAPIINLGLNRNGTLQVPSTTTVVGWYTGSPRPGATGSAIIAGHVDSRTGPGVFFWLRKMRPGERIYVRRADGTLAVFTVTVVHLYAKSDFPTTTVYGPVPDAELRLITCGGTFDYTTRHYLSNVVVYARLST
jgi:sortase (surface protein transpeptidase)